MKKLVFISFVIIMFFFKNFASAKYDKVFYDFQIKSISGELIDLKKYKDKAILLVNTASYCNNKKQYDGLQELWKKYESQGLVVLGVPSDSFNQEKKSNNEVKEFCEVNFNVNFPLTEITEVKGKKAHPIYIWAKENFGNSAIPKWNFHKILINKEGKVENTYGSLTKPMSNKLILEIEKIL